MNKYKLNVNINDGSGISKIKFSVETNKSIENLKSIIEKEYI
jgi:hypothetical protein